MTDAAEGRDACDDGTPREVWQEYEHQKAKLDREVERAVRDLWAERDAKLSRWADELGCGVAADALTSAQRARQTTAVRNWRGAFGSGGCAP